MHALSRPLVVDLDGTLIRTDLLVESASQFLIQNPFQFFKPLLWLMRGKVALKSELAQRIQLDASALPYNTDVLDWLRAEKLSGRRLVLATASHRRLAEQVAQHLAMDRRTLHRHLQAEGETFSSLMQSVRSEFALRQITDSDHAMAELAELLGFSGASAFAFWFRRRFGCTVSVWRKSKQQQEQAALQLAVPVTGPVQGLDPAN